MYLGFALLLLAWGLYLANMATLFGLPAYMFYMNQFQIKPEERALAEKFGRDYTQYRQRQSAGCDISARLITMSAGLSE